MDEQAERLAREVDRCVRALAARGQYGKDLTLVLDRMTRRTGGVGPGEPLLPPAIEDREVRAGGPAYRIEELLELTGWNQAS